MYTLYETPKEFEGLAAELKELVTDITSRVSGSGQTIRVPANEDLSSPVYRNGKLHIVREGMLACSRGGSNIFYYDEGDIIGLDLRFLPIDTCKIWSEMAVVVEERSLDDVLKAVSDDWSLFQQWNRLQGCQMTLYLLCLASLAKNPPDHAPRDVKRVPAGVVMIEQGTRADEVCTLIEGQADVLVNGVKVGCVLAGETFGVVAAMTDSSRNATVQAVTDCVVMTMRPDQLRQLIETRPHTTQKLIEDMARVIKDLNEQLVESRLGTTAAARA